MWRIILFILAGATASPAGAQGLPAPAARPEDELGAMRRAVARGEALSLAKVLPSVMAVMPGKILDVKFAQIETGPVYVIYDLAPDWHLWILIVDARTGTVLNPPEVSAPKARKQS